MAKKKNLITLELQKEADIQISEMRKQIDYDTKDYTLEHLVNKFHSKDFFIPLYQREFIWNDKKKSLFIESILLGMPIPFMFFADCENGKVEIIDGAQRFQTIVQFFSGKLELNDLKKLTKLNGFYFDDLSESQKRKLQNKSLRIIVLEEDTPLQTRQDLFNRINTTGEKANPSEIRRGAYPGPLTSFIEECAKSKLFKQLTPMNSNLVKRHERFEFVLRFFAYLNEYEKFGHIVDQFLDDYLINYLVDFDDEVFEHEFNAMIDFVSENFPFGFAKTGNSKATPRVRFEAISVGVGLALRVKKDLKVSNVDWINSSEFKNLTTSDGSNNQGRLKKRVEYVRDELLKER